MDGTRPISSSGGEFRWSDAHSLCSDDEQSSMLRYSMSWASTGSSTTSYGSSSGATVTTGHLSPVSDNTDNAATSSIPAMMHSTNSSSCTDSWSTDCGEADDAASADHFEDDMAWAHPSDILTVPKLEAFDDEDNFCMDDIKEAPAHSTIESDVPAPAPGITKRPRGRPRKHVLAPIVTSNKVAKGRSKTGCLTCRKRKKKCDEAKPRCLNCEKNAVVCEGYPEKQLWRSGKQRAEEERLKAHSHLTMTLQPIFWGLETAEDRVFWKHYNERLSTVLTVEGEHRNAFKDLMIPIAIKHQGLMHSILALASKHIDFDTPYGINLLKSNPGVTIQSLQDRSDFHHDSAISKFYEDIAKPEDKESRDYKDMLSARYGQILCLLLESVADGNPRGEHRVHLEAFRRLIKQTPPHDEAFFTFVTEMFQYHVFADDLIRLPTPDTPRLASEDWVPVHPIQPARLLGVADGLLNLLAGITTIRNKVRRRIADGYDPVIDYECIYEAAQLDASIQNWQPEWPCGDTRNQVGLLYQQMLWVYLYQSIYPPPTPATPRLSRHDSSATSFASHGAMCTPPQSAVASCASSPRSQPRSNPPSRKNSGSDAPRMDEGTRSEVPPVSPSSSRSPAGQDARVTKAVDESLAFIESFSPSDPSQKLLLMPCLVVGASCFSEDRQERVRKALKTVRGYTGLRNTDRVTVLLEEVWRLMDRGDWSAVWDWQQVARDLGLDFLCA